MTSLKEQEDETLVLAAEDCPPEHFARLHIFSTYDEPILKKLVSHGPVLLRGGRGTGKSALMIEAQRRLLESKNALGIYLSLRHLELLDGREENYEEYLCNLLMLSLREVLNSSNWCATEDLPDPPVWNVSGVRSVLNNVASRTEKRIVLLFDDAAHIGREKPLSKFFDVFRTLSGSAVSCKATIYPGVTNFGNRFDLLNDATVVDVARNDELPGFHEFFDAVLETRHSTSLKKSLFQATPRKNAAGFLGKAVLGNMRGFLFACNELSRRSLGASISLDQIGETLKSLSSNHFWPMLDEIKPKLSKYSPMIETSQTLADFLLKTCVEKDAPRTSIIVAREIVERLGKPFEILEYADFITKREASRAMKSGGRGARYAVNLCLLLEQAPGSRLTRVLFEAWLRNEGEPAQLSKSMESGRIVLPDLKVADELEILSMSITTLKKSNVYPYGITDSKVEVLESRGYVTIRDVYNASDEDILSVETIGPESLKKIRSAVHQAVWM